MIQAAKIIGAGLATNIFKPLLFYIAWILNKPPKPHKFVNLNLGSTFTPVTASLSTAGMTITIGVICLVSAFFFVKIKYTQNTLPLVWSQSDIELIFDIRLFSLVDLKEIGLGENPRHGGINNDNLIFLNHMLSLNITPEQHEIVFNLIKLFDDIMRLTSIGVVETQDLHLLIAQHTNALLDNLSAQDESYQKLIEYTHKWYSSIKDM